MKIKINPEKLVGKIKPMHAVNNGPLYTKNADQDSTNLPAYKAARIPFARTHDASIYYSYGGEHTVDIGNIFTDFDADVNDPASYDFALTDFYLEGIQMAGTETFFRLGNKIEHWVKKYGIYPPKDNLKWAQICEHIIAHYNYGWANGYEMGIRYWEIWNEPDLYGKCWMGTPEEFYELFAVTAKHLKSKFPELKIGGPAVCCYREDWLVPFFEKLKAENVPLDFYSWHCYARETGSVISNIRRHRAILDKYGYTETESILDEWNYVRDWSGEAWAYSLATEKNVKGAAFTSAVMSVSQNEAVDMLMYYDARPNSGMNGLFRMEDYKPGKTYPVICAWSDLYDCDAQCEVSCDIPDIYVTSAVKNGEVITMITYYTDDDSALPINFKVEIPGDKLWTLSLLDDDHFMTPVERIASDNGIFRLTMKPNTVVVLK